MNNTIDNKTLNPHNDIHTKTQELKNINNRYINAPKAGASPLL